MSGQLLGDLISSLGELTVQKKALETDLKLIESRIASVESEIMSAMDRDGLKISANASGKVALDTHIYPKLEAWDLLEDHMLETRSLALIQHRIAVLTYREMLSLGRAVPGVVPSHVRKLTYKVLNNDD